mgnify:CR=1 FL=1
MAPDARTALLLASEGFSGEEIAATIGYPVLVRPSYVLGGRAMRVCYDEGQVRAAMASVTGPVLVDRFLEGALEIDVDALCDGVSVHVGAVMEHVEEAGIHSGDSSCVLPSPSLSDEQYEEVCRIVRRLGPALGVVGLLNVQLALVGGDVHVLEVNPRASRTVPFASKATGVNLVDAAVRLAAGRRLHELELPRERRPELVSVKAAVLPFARFPGADPVLGPEMRSTGEVMASAADLPTAFAKAERAAGRPLPTAGTAFLSVRDLDKPAIGAVAEALAELGFRLLATAGTAAVVDGGALAIEQQRGREKDRTTAGARWRSHHADPLPLNPSDGPRLPQRRDLVQPVANLVQDVGRLLAGRRYRVHPVGGALQVERRHDRLDLAGRGLHRLPAAAGGQLRVAEEFRHLQEVAVGNVGRLQPPRHLGPVKGGQRILDRGFQRLPVDPAQGGGRVAWVG